MEGIVLIGASLGGLDAVKQVFSALPTSLSLPIALVQHRQRDASGGFLGILRQCTALPICEPEDKEEIVPGHIYVAPPDYHLLVGCGRFHLSTDDPVCYARPSIDVLFESAASAYKSRAIGLILTGSGRDGSRGAAAIRKRGATLVVQDPKTAYSKEMPEAALTATAADFVLPLEEIGAWLATRAGAGKEVCGHG
jgi:two-component system chemotaxis response regulator CheB